MGAAEALGLPRPGTAGGGGGSLRASSAAVDILAAGRPRGGSMRGGTAAAEALGIGRLSGSLRGANLAQDALNRQFAE
jgi:hypothetical protein